MITTTHENCAICDWLGREAERTAREFARDHWSSYDTERDGTEHVAHYAQEDTP